MKQAFLSYTIDCYNASGSPGKRFLSSFWVLSQWPFLLFYRNLDFELNSFPQKIHQFTHYFVRTNRIHTNKQNSNPSSVRWSTTCLDTVQKRFISTPVQRNLNNNVNTCTPMLKKKEVISLPYSHQNSALLSRSELPCCQNAVKLGGQIG